jgi:hypothetical protein
MSDTRVVSLDPRFERVLAELALWERRARHRHGPDGVGETLTALSLLPDPRLAT